MKAIIPTFEGWSSYAHGFADLQFPILAWEEFLFVQPREAVHAIAGETFVERVDAVTVRVGMAEEYFQGATSGCHKG